MKTLKDLGDLKGKRVLVRADFNVPLDGTTITDDGRIKAALPTIKALREQGAKVILMAHLGRPKGKVVPELSLAPVAARLGELLGITVPLAADTYGEDAQAKVAGYERWRRPCCCRTCVSTRRNQQGSGRARHIRQEDRRSR